MKSLGSVTDVVDLEVLKKEVDCVAMTCFEIAFAS